MNNIHMFYDIDYEICAFIFLFLLTSVVSFFKKLENLQSKLFRTFLIGTLAYLAFDIARSYTIEYFVEVPLWINVAVTTIFFIIVFSIPYIFFLYLLEEMHEIKEYERKNLMLCGIPALLGCISVLVNFPTKWLFYFDETGYKWGPYHDFVYVVPVMYVLIISVFIFTNRHRTTRKKTIISCIITAVYGATYIIQFVNPSVLVTGLGMVLAIFFLHMTSENVEGYVDNATETRNREAFIKCAGEYIADKHPEQIFVIALDNFKLKNEIYGMKGGDEILASLATKLKEYFGTERVFRYSGDVFIVMLEEINEADVELDKINNILNSEVELNGTIVSLSACICLVHSIHHEKDDLVRAIDSAIATAKEMGKGQFYEVDLAVAEKLARRTAIEQAMYKSIEAGEFEVHYQPIVDVETNRFHSMEALARLNVPGYGYVSPEEFIKIAEQNGSITDIGMLVLNEVCKFIREDNLATLGIDFVEVNLSVVQCVQERIHNTIMDTLSRHDILPSMINLEITESAAAYSEEILVRNMAKLNDSNISFSLDDYGSGYSNVNYIVDLPFSIVKLDKYIVWAAMKKETSLKILEKTVAMFKAINLKVVAEGVETKEMADTLIDMGVDYLQGYYYSKPVRREVMLELLKNGVAIGGK